MPTISAADVVGRTITVKKGEVSAVHYTNGEPTHTFKKGDTIGVVYSWIQEGGKIYWMFFNESIGNQYGSFYVEHDDKKLSLIEQPTDKEDGDFWAFNWLPDFSKNPFGNDGALNSTLNKVIFILLLLLVIYYVPKIIKTVKSYSNG